MLIADGGGGSRPSVVPATHRSQPQPARNNNQQAAADRARELQRQIEAQQARIRELQRQAAEARRRAEEARRKAEEARIAADAARRKADQEKSLANEAAARQKEQDHALADARMRKESADVQQKEKEIALAEAREAQKKDAQKNDGKASADHDKQVKTAQEQVDAASRTTERSNEYLDYQEKETKAQAAEAEVAKATPTPGRPSYTVTDAEWSALQKARDAATPLRADADAAKKTFTSGIAEDMPEELGPLTTSASPLAPVPGASALPQDPLHSPLVQFLQLSPTAPDATGTPPTLTPTPGQTPGSAQPSLLATGTPFSLSPTLAPKVTPQVTQTLSGIADGKSVDEIAKDRHMTRDQVIAEAKAAGVTIEVGATDEKTQQTTTTVKRGDGTLEYTHDDKAGSVTLKGTFTDPKAPDGTRTIEASRDKDGRFSQTSTDPKTGRPVTHAIDPNAGTRTDTVTNKDGSTTATTTDLTGATVTRAVKPGEDYLDVAKAAGLTPEQLLALNPDVDYGKVLKDGQELVVSGVKTTTVTTNKDGTTLEKTVESDGTIQAEATTADGRTVTLMGEGDPKDATSEKIRKGLFTDGKTVAEMAKATGLTEKQVLDALPPGTVHVTEPTSDNGDVETRTIYDPRSNKVVVETHDWQHDGTTHKLIDDKTSFKVRQLDPETGKDVVKEVSGGVGYLQKLADDQLAHVGDYDRQIADLDETIRLYNKMGDSPDELRKQREDLVNRRDAAKGEAGIVQARATSALLRNQQEKLDRIAANAYQGLSVARPGSKEQAEARKSLDEILALTDKVDRLVKSGDKDVAFLIADLDRRQSHTRKSEADENLQSSFQKWKDEVWMWQGVDPETAQKLKEEGLRPHTRIFADADQENEIAWEAFEHQLKDWDRYGTEGITDTERAARNAWHERDQASVAEVASNDAYYAASIGKGDADAHVAQGEVDRLQARKDAWVADHPDDFSEAFPALNGEHGGQQKLDELNEQVTQLKVGVIRDNKSLKYNEFIRGLSVEDREDPEKLKEAGAKYAEDNAERIEAADQEIEARLMEGLTHRAKASEAYIAQWNRDNPRLKEQLDALAPETVPDGRMREQAALKREDLLKSSHEFRQLKAAESMEITTRYKLGQVAEGDVERIEKDEEAIDKTVDGQTFLRDMFSDKAEDTQKWTRDQKKEAQTLRDDLSSGKITLTEYTDRQKALMAGEDGYGFESLDKADSLRDDTETWAVIDDTVRMSTAAVAGILTTIGTGGNIAAGIGVGMLVNQMWDTGNDVYAAANGRDIYADGHSSVVTLTSRALFDDDVTWDQAKLTFKDDAIDTGHAVVSALGVGAGMRTTAYLAGRAAVPGQALSAGSRAVIGMKSGAVSQAVDGGGRFGLEALDVAFDGQWGTDVGNARLKGSAINAGVGVAMAFPVGYLSGLIPMHATKIFTPTLALQTLTDAGGSLAVGQLSSLANDGTGMDRTEFIAAAAQVLPGTMTNIAMHPSRVAPAHKPPSGDGFAADGTPLDPTTLGPARTWDAVSDKTNLDRMVLQHDQATRNVAGVQAHQASKGETAVLNWLRSDPARRSGTRFVVSRAGPDETIYSANPGLRVRSRDTYKTFEQARAAAANDGGWVHRVQPHKDGMRLAVRPRVRGDEIVGAIHVNRQGEVLPVGIPNMRHASDLVQANGRPGMFNPAKAIIRASTGPSRFLAGVVTVQGGAIAAKIFGAGSLFDNVTGGPVAAWINQTRGFGTRFAYFSGKRGLENALDLARRGESDAAQRQVNIVANQKALRGLSPEEVKAKKQAALDQLGQFGDAARLYHQGVRDAGVPASALHDHELVLASEADIKAGGNTQQLKDMPDGTLVAASREVTQLRQAIKDPGASPARLAAAVDAVRTQLALDQMQQISAPVMQRLRDAVADPVKHRLPDADRAEVEAALGGPIEWGPLLPARVAESVRLNDAAPHGLTRQQQQDQADLSAALPADVLAQFVKAREGEVGYGIARDMVNAKGNLINMKDVQGALGSTMHMGSRVGVAFKYGALGFAANSGLSGTYNFLKQVIHPQRLDKPLIPGFDHPLIKTFALSGEVVGNVPSVGTNLTYLVGLLRRTTFADDSAGSTVPIRKVEAYVDKRISRMESVAEGRTVPISWELAWKPWRVLRYRVGWETMLSLVPAKTKLKVGGQIQRDDLARDAAKAANLPEPSTDLKLVKYMLLRQRNARERVTTLQTAKTEAAAQNNPLLLRTAAKDESVAAAKSMNTANDFMAVPSMFRYSMMALTFSNPAVAAFTAFHGIVSNAGWLRAQQGKGTIYGVKMAPTGLYDGHGLLWVGKRVGRLYNTLMEKVPDTVGERMATGAKSLPGVGRWVKTDNVVDALKLGPTAEDAANRRRMRMMVTGAVAPTLGLVVKLLQDDEKDQPLRLPSGDGIGPWNPDPVHPGEPTRDNHFARVLPPSLPDTNPGPVDDTTAPTHPALAQFFNFGPGSKPASQAMT